MHHELRLPALKGRLNCAAVDKIAPRIDEGRELRKLGEPRLLQRDVVVGVEVVQSDNLSSGCEQAFGDEEADEAGRSRNQDGPSCERQLAHAPFAPIIRAQC